MKPLTTRRKCLNCKEFFLLDYRNAHHQRYCQKVACRQAKQREAQRAWLAKPANRNYFRDEQNAQRVRDWQKEHPGYWKNTARYRRRTLQDDCPQQVAASAPVTENTPSGTLQELCSRPAPLLVGLISMFTGSTLPEDIATSTRRLLSKGQDILGMVPTMNLESLVHE